MKTDVASTVISWFTVVLKQKDSGGRLHVTRLPTFIR